jgi:hypothetical protein
MTLIDDLERCISHIKIDSIDNSNWHQEFYELCMKADPLLEGRTETGEIGWISSDKKIVGFLEDRFKVFITHPSRKHTLCSVYDYKDQMLYTVVSKNKRRFSNRLNKIIILS